MRYPPETIDTIGTDSATNPGVEAVRLHLAALLSSSDFTTAPRLAKFLSFIVETALAGNGERIKETLIAVEVYGRRPDYNPQTDTTVRVDARRLRDHLAQYYESIGKGEPLRIEVPKGTYIPVFRIVPACAPPAMSRIRRSHLTVAAMVLSAGVSAILWAARAEDKRPPIRSLAVLPFRSLSKDDATGRLSDGLAEEIATALTREAKIRVASCNTMVRYQSTPST